MRFNGTSVHTLLTAFNAGTQTTYFIFLIAPTPILKRFAWRHWGAVFSHTSSVFLECGAYLLAESFLGHEPPACLQHTQHRTYSLAPDSRCLRTLALLIACK